MPEPTKAYYVERVARTVTTILVFANSAKEARERVWTDGQSIDTFSEPRGFRRPRRVPSEDRPAPAATPKGGEDRG